MKALLKFDLSDIDDRDAFDRCNKADAMASVLWEFLFNTKKSIESAVEVNKIDTYDAVDLVYDKLRDMLNDESIDIEQLWK